MNVSTPVNDGQTPDYSTEARLETSDDQAAPVPEDPRADCIPVGGILISVYLLSGLMAGVAGLLTAGRTDAGAPTSAAWQNLDEYRDRC